MWWPNPFGSSVVTGCKDEGGGGGGRGLMELQNMKSHPPLWIPAMISNPSGIREVLRSRGGAWLSFLSGLSFSLDRSVWKLTWPLPWRNAQCLGLCNPLSVQYFVSSSKSNIPSSPVCVFVVLECRRGRSPRLWSADQRTTVAQLQEGAFLLASSHGALKMSLEMWFSGRVLA